MPRRIELADVADGITGHVIRDTPWDRVWPMGGIVRAVRDGFGTEYRFDLMTGDVDPATRELAETGSRLRADLERHLAVRRLRPEWVRSASLTATVKISAAVDGRRAPVTCRVEITDDLGREHTSTRHNMSDLAATTFVGRFFERFFRGR